MAVLLLLQMQPLLMQILGLFVQATVESRPSSMLVVHVNAVRYAQIRRQMSLRQRHIVAIAGRTTLIWSWGGRTISIIIIIPPVCGVCVHIRVVDVMLIVWDKGGLGGIS